MHARSVSHRFGQYWHGQNGILVSGIDLIGADMERASARDCSVIGQSAHIGIPCELVPIVLIVTRSRVAVLFSPNENTPLAPSAAVVIARSVISILKRAQCPWKIFIAPRRVGRVR